MSYLENTKTLQNLITAYKRESITRDKYKAYGKKAYEEGYIDISEIFYRVSKEENAHAVRFLQLIEEGIGKENIKIMVDNEIYNGLSTVDNLKEALLGENDVWRNIYPIYAAEAELDGFESIGAVFKLFGMVEKTHEMAFIRIYNDLRNNRYLKKVSIVTWVCTNCGIISEGYEPPEFCPGCLVHKGYFKHLV